jgi:formylglycine-generating enzyme required for sulfatase activity
MKLRPVDWVPPDSFDEYRLVQALGRSSTHQVWLAHDTVLDRQVVVEFLTEIPVDEAVRRRFLRAARAAARVQHPNIVAVYRVGEIGSRPYLVSEHVRGEGLEMARPVAWSRLREIALDLSRGLAAAHRQGVVHGDLTPANVIVSQTGEIKLRNFELATAKLGTSAYVSPEAGRGDPVTPRSDIFALGALLYALAAGTPPPHGDGDAPPLAAMAPGIDPRFAAIVHRCLRSDPRQRFASGDSAYAALAALAVDPAGPKVRARKQRPSHRRLLIFLSVIVLVGVVLARFSVRAPALPRACPAGMAAVPAGTFQMGSPDGAGDADEQPQHEVTLSAYCIDKTEVSVTAYATCVAAGSCRASLQTAKLQSSSDARLQRLSLGCNGEERSRHPINCVDWAQAVAYCAWNDKRLPTEAEWEYAARGPDGRVYPWGSQAPSADRMKLCDRECFSFMSSNDIDNGWRPTTPVGSYPGGASPFGVLDMAGNVREWTADWYGPYTAQAAVNPQGPSTGTSRVSRGGASIVRYRNNQVRAADRDWPDPTIRAADLGFRCAR